MKCPKCQTENPENLKFCGECGAKLEKICPHCNSSNPPQFKFCGECGHELTRPKEGPSHAYPKPESYTPKYLAEKILTSRTAIEGERKQVTVLFADLKGSMELLADRDPEEARKLLDSVVERMMEAVHRYEGTVNSVMGDGIMALFGAPLAHEDHAVRACYAALDMQAAIRRWAEEARRSHGISIEIRVGLNSGEVVVCTISSDLHMDYTAVGQTTHLAARMEQLAGEGKIFLTASTLRLAEGYIEVKPLGPVPVKGLEAPIEVYELTGGGPLRSRLHTAAARGLTRFVGREGELEHLRKALGRASDGHGQVVAIVGEPGVGKSRLVWEATHSHRVHGWLVVQAGSVSYGKATSYLPVVGLLKSYFAIEDRDGPRAARERLTGKLLTMDRALEGSLPALLSLLDVPTDDRQWPTLDPPQRRRRTQEAVKRLLLRESQVQPLLVVFEDLHWIDTESQALLDSLVESLPTARLLLLVNYRPEYQHTWGNRTYYTQLRLDPLPPESAEELLNVLLGTDVGLDSLKRVLIARTEGNPFFLEESVQSLAETGTLLGERGAYRLVQPLQTVQIPATVQVVLAARIDRLPVEDKAILQMASVVGRDVPFALLQAIAGTSEDALHAAIGRLQAAEFLYEASVFPDLEYTFKHALTHEVIYGSLLQNRRRRLHGRIVEATERLYPDRLMEHVERLAHHAFRGEDWVRAVNYLQQAGAKAAARSSNREALAYFEEAMTALTHVPETLEAQKRAIDLRFDLRNSLHTLAEFGRIEGYLHEAERLATMLDDQRRLGWVLAYMSGHQVHIGGLVADMRAFAQRVETIGETLGDVPLQVAAQYYLVMACYIAGDYRGTEQGCRRLMDSLTGDRTRERFGLAVLPAVMSRAHLARALAERGVFEEGNAYGQEAILIAEALDHPFSLLWACLGQAYLHSIKEEVDEAARLLERAVGLCREWSITTYIPVAMASLGHAYARSGRIGEGVSLLQQALATYESAGIGYCHSISVVQLGEAYLQAGQVVGARACADQAVMLARRRGERAHEAWALRLLGETASHQSHADVAPAEAHYGGAMALASELEMRPLLAHCHLGLSRLYKRAAKWDKVQEHLTVATTMFRQMDMKFRLEKSEAEEKELPERA